MINYTKFFFLYSAMEKYHPDSAHKKSVLPAYMHTVRHMDENAALCWEYVSAVSAAAVQIE